MTQEFAKTGWMIWIDSLGFYDEEGAAEELKKQGTVEEIRIELRMNGFKKGGAKAFNIMGELMADLQQFYYKIGKHRHDNSVILERVYHMLPNKAEMKEIEESFKDALYEQLEQNIERIRK